MPRRFHNAAAEIIDSHDRFHADLEGATAVAHQLVVDPELADARERTADLWSFVRDRALPHIDHEEALLFPRILERGVPLVCVEALRGEHAELRHIAYRLAEGVSMRAKERRKLLLEFVELFAAHAVREEAVLSLFHARLVEPRRRHVGC